MYTNQIAQDIAAEAAAYKDRLAMMTAGLTSLRQTLAAKVIDSYNPEAFPGSREWKRNGAAVRALNAFDAANPEVNAEIETRRNAADHAAANSPSAWNL